MFHILAKWAEYALPEVAQCGAPRQPVEHQRQMQHDQIETAIDRLSDRIVAVKARQSRLRRDWVRSEMVSRRSPRRNRGKMSRAGSGISGRLPPVKSTPAPMQGRNDGTRVWVRKQHRRHGRVASGPRLALAFACALALAACGNFWESCSAAMFAGRRTRANSGRRLPQAGSDRAGDTLHRRHRHKLLYFAKVRARTRSSTNG